ncbi:helix-turn-helix domain-containing protein [Paracidovorax citrulli]|nr:helix-turn-helix domain-containing protein [Paracidovorax citrulli]
MLRRVMAACFNVSMDTLKSAAPHPSDEVRDTYASALGDRIRKCRGTLTREDFARRLELHVNTIGKFERGLTVPDAFVLLRMAEVGGCQVQWLLTGEEPTPSVPKNIRAVEVGSYVFVPHFDVQLSAGHGVFADVETVLAMRPFDAKFIRQELGISHDDLALVSVVGNSMEPYLRSRDTTLLDRRANDVGAEGIHAIRLDGALMLKFVQRLPGKVLRVSSANQDYAPFEVTGTEETERDFAVLGRVRWGGVTFN